jgi:hypothetical protein
MKTTATPSTRTRTAGSPPRRQAAASPRAATGLPAPLRHGIEALSGLSMEAVRVHTDSPAPARLGALAFAQGTDIHLGPGQQQHLPHEAWHVVQQLQGRVTPTLQLRAAVPGNDDAALEHEADVMGQRALLHAVGGAVPAARAAPVTGAIAVVQRLSAKLGKKYKDDPGAEALRIWQQETGLADKELDALEAQGRLIDAFEHLADDQVPKANNKRVDAIIRLLDGMADDRPEPQAPRSLRDRLQIELGMSTNIADLVLADGKASDKALGQLLDQNAPGTEALLMCVASGKNTLQGVQTLVQTHGARYATAQLLQWANAYGDVATAQALVDTSHETDASYVGNWLAYGVTAASPVQLRQLVRFQALMAAGARLSVAQQDRRYQGTEAKRTGFLRHAFSDGTVMNIHTHWARADMALVSMHVQDLGGNNGLEMNQWKWFGDVAQEVLAAHNRAVGPLRPSKSGTGATTTYGQLSLPTGG